MTETRMAREVESVSHTWIVVGSDGEAGTALDVLGASSDPTALVVGSRDLAEHVARSVGDVRWIDAGGMPLEAWAQAAATIVAAETPAAVIAVATPGGRAIMGAIAARLDAPLLSDVTTIRAREGGIEAERPALGGLIVETLHASTPLCVLAAPADTASPVRREAGAITAVPATPSAAVTRVKVEPSPDAGSRIAEAERVVSVGRGLGSKDSLGIVEQLVTALGAELGCSMPVADELGWVSGDRYVGWSGQHISPKLYLALGISGAPQHIAGMRNSHTIVAVNTDPNAPIFKTAHYGIVADLHQVVPELIEALGQ